MATRPVITSARARKIRKQVQTYVRLLVADDSDVGASAEQMTPPYQWEDLSKDELKLANAEVRAILKQIRMRG